MHYESINSDLKSLRFFKPGGYGGKAKYILSKYPQMKSIVLDVNDVIEEASSRPHDNRLSFVVGKKIT